MTVLAEVSGSTSCHDTLPFSRLVIVAPHPDDETLGAGGLAHRLQREGGEVHVLLGMVTNDGREDELAAACGVLGVSSWATIGRVSTETVPDFQFIDDHTTTQAVLIDRINDHLTAIEPDAVVLPPVAGYNQEHRLLAAATLAALRPNAGTWRPMVPFVACYEHGGDHWGVQPAPTPTFFVELDEADIDAKIGALHAHASQVRDAPSERSARSVDALARLRGLQAGVMFAEGFEIRRWLR
jgi:LmbE family N-acetylglucosaminyl deacetylase